MYFPKIINYNMADPRTYVLEAKIRRKVKKLSALSFFQFIYTKVGVEQVRHFST
jgi:hypothetical protein